MTHIDHHINPYDEATLNKLEIFERYVEAWLPTFIMQKAIKRINIVDFFAGPGYDSNSVAGSPIRVLEKINSFYDKLEANPTEIILYFNEFKASKFNKLKNNCINYLEENNRLLKFVRIYYSCNDFNDIYKEITSSINNEINLFIIDQSGIRFTSKNNFNTLLALKKTDFLFFISSSFFNRFNDKEEFSKHLHLDKEQLESNPYNFIHRVVLDKYRSMIPSDSKLRIFPFSIKKGSNIYGIIFGSNHIRGVEKFLKIAWDKNKINGEADYDIDDDSSKNQLELNFDNPSESKNLTKIESFQNCIEEFLRSKRIVTNRDLYYFTYNEGYTSKHTIDHLRKLKSEKRLSYNGATRINWYSIDKEILVTFKWLG